MSSTQVTFILDDPNFYYSDETTLRSFIKICKLHDCEIKVNPVTKTTKVSPPPSQSNPKNYSSAPSFYFIDIRQGDLIEQTVDAIVVSSTSDILRNNIVDKAGPTVKSVFSSKEHKEDAIIETEGGLLPCKSIVFRRCNMQGTDSVTRRKNINRFIHDTIEHAVSKNYQSIAFPAINCGGHAWDSNLVAEEMVLEIQKFASAKLQILITILKFRKELYETFCSTLIKFRETPAKLSEESFTYSTKALHITIDGKSKASVEECIKELKDFIRRSVATVTCSNFPVHTWNQTFINQFYEYCERHHVFPKITENDGVLKLSGDAHGVNSATKEFYRMKSEVLENNYASLLGRHIIWAVEDQKSGYQKYSPALNARIEDAYQAHIETISFINDVDECCKIDFKSMRETSNHRSQWRPVIRNDFPLPAHWALQTDDLATIEITDDSNEYKKVLAYFSETMEANKQYRRIVSITRIQNQRWHITYECYKKYLRSDANEKWLFHGCAETSAGLIIYSCFNRSFAGIHGALYGKGVYFSQKASYSHSYAQTAGANGIHHMFLVKVLVGRCTTGKPEMITPPNGYHSTTDDDHIFVTYHDDQAYAEYLIKYI